MIWNRSRRPKDQALHNPALSLLLFAVMAQGACGKLNSRPPSSSSSAVAEKAYLQQIVITGAHMTEASNFLGQDVITLNAKITNHGQKVVRSLKLELEFMDIAQQKVVLDKIVEPITAALPPLKPGETRDFSISFEQMPDEWNQGPPRITPSGVGF